MWGKDYRRTLDYLSTRADIDTAKFAYFGVSWGGYFGGIIPAIDKLFSVDVIGANGCKRILKSVIRNELPAT